MKSCIIITKPSIDELTKAKTATYGRQSIVPRNDVADDEEVSAQLRRLQGDRSVPSSYRRPYQSRTRRNNRNNEDSSDSSDDDSSDDDGVVVTKKKSSLKRLSGGRGRGRGIITKKVCNDLEDTSDEEDDDDGDEDEEWTSNPRKKKQQKRAPRKVSM